MKHQINIVLAAATLIVASDGLAQSQMQSPSVQAKRGQSQAQQSRDTDRCSMQARKQTGVDPIAIAANATPLQPGKGITSTPIEAPSTAMGASAAGATAAGTGDMGASQQMGSSASGQMSNAATGQMGNTSGEMTGAGSGQMQTGTGQTANAGSGQMGSSSTGQTGSSSTEQMSNAPQTGTATSNSNWATATPSRGTTGAAAAGTSSTGASASGATGSSGNTLAMEDSASVYNQAFSNCMSGHGYVVGSNSQ